MGYFTPFISTNDSVKLNGREREDVDIGDAGYRLVPQIISNDSRQSTLYIRLLNEKYFYKEININMGCPSGTVTSKKKGSGLIKDPEYLDEFLDGLFKELDGFEKEGFEVPDISIKTRIGYYSESEYRGLLDVFLRYPVKQFIIHPRSRNEFYNGKVHLEEFSLMYDELKKCSGVVYNGDVKSKEDYELITERFPELDGVMVGRGLLSDPGLARKIKGGKGAKWSEYLEYMESLLDEYASEIGSAKNVLAKMKDLWNFANIYFTGNEKGYKEMCKATTIETYRVCMRQFIKNSDIVV